MPSSNYYQINEIIEVITRLQPARVLDIGPGFGKYGVLTREYLELWDGRDKYDDWKTTIDCIEAHEQYITPLHRYIYDNVYIGDAGNLINDLELRYDLVLMIDVLEHFEHTDGKKILDYFARQDCHILISTPKFVNPQADAFDNPYETHRSSWKKEFFKSYPSRFIMRHHSCLIVLLGPQAQRIAKEFRWNKRYLFLKKNFRFLRIFKRAFSH